MTKTLTKHGNSLALVIDKPILDLLHIDADTPLSIKTDGRCLVISPSDSKRQKRLRTSLENINREWGEVFKRLAE
jgi:antitoxin MazE